MNVPKCVICALPAKSRQLCRAHYEGARRIKVLKEFPKLPTSTGRIEAEVRQYLSRHSQGNGGETVPAALECCGRRFKNVHGLQVHIGRKHLGGKEVPT